MRRLSRRRTVFRLPILILFLTALIALASLYYPKLLRSANYPMTYAAEIREAALEFSVPPALVASVVKTESSFRAVAESDLGARGLMQLMPDTGAWLAGKLKLADFAAEDLFTPSVNLRMGCWYLRFLLDRYGGNMIYAVAAYHAGQGQMDKWLADELSLSGLLRVPEGSTRNYVQKVMEAYENYIYLY